MDVTAVIPTLGRRPEMLRRAVESAFSQTVAVQTVLVVVDGDEHVRKRVAAQLRPHNSLRVESTNRCGVSNARNHGARVATTQYLAFLDDDDWWLDDFIGAFSDQELDVGLAAFLKLGRSGLTPEKTPPAVLHARRFLVTNPGLRGSNLFIRRSVFLSMNGFDPSLPAFNDLDFGVRLAAQPHLRYTRTTRRLVVFNSHQGERLSTRGCTANREGALRFWGLYQARMSPTERARFCQRAVHLWGIDPSSEATCHA